MTKKGIIEKTNTQFEKIKSITIRMDDALFFTKPSNKWSVSDNIKYILIYKNISALAFWLPKFLVRWIGGIPNRPSKTFEELVNKYTLKLAEGGVVTGKFVPKLNKDLSSKSSLLKQWNKVSTHYLSTLIK